LSLMLMMTVLPACSSQQTSQERIVQDTQHIEDPIRALQARAELEALQPMPAATTEVLESISTSSIEQLVVGTPDYQRALSSLDEIVMALNTKYSLPVAPELTDEITPAIRRQRTQAMKLYAQARALRQTGKMPQAIEMLEQASMLDPYSGSIHRELGDALIVSNDRVGAMDAFTRAFELGSYSPRSLIHLASQANEGNDPQRVVWLASSALALGDVSNFPLAQSIAQTLMGNSLIRLGHLSAGAETLSSGITTFNTSSRDIRWRREIVQMLNERTRMWMLAGDAWGALSAHDRAENAYQRARDEQTSSSVSLVARQIASSLRRGHNAQSALLLLEHLSGNVSDLGPIELELARTISTVDGAKDLLALSIRELSEQDGLTPSIQSSLLTIELIALDTDSSISRLSDPSITQVDPIAVRRLLSTLESDEDRSNLATQILDSNPALARSISTALIRSIENPLELLQEYSRPDSQGQELLMASVGIALGRSDLIGHLDDLDLDNLDRTESDSTGDSTGDSTDISASDASEETTVYLRSTDWISTHAQATALVGNWADCSILIEELESRASSDHEGDYNNADKRALNQLASTLLVAQQPTNALETAQLMCNDADASAEDLLAGGQIAQTLQSYEAAASYFERALELDPFNERIYEMLYLLRSSSSPVGDEEELRFVVRELGTNRPRSSLFGLIRAHELARNGLLNDAERLLIELNRQRPYREIGYDLLLSIWKSQDNQIAEQSNQSGATDANVSDENIDREMLSSGVDWISLRIETDPNSVQSVMMIAQGLFDLERHDESLALLEKVYERTGSFEIARAMEQLLDGPLDRAADADAHLRARLDGLGGVDPTVEYARELSLDSESASFIDVIRSNIPESIELLPSQRDQLTQIVFAMAGQNDTVDNGDAILDLISVIELRSEQLSFELARVRLILLSQQQQLDLDQLVLEINELTGQAVNEEERSALQALPIQSLLSEDRPHEAIMLAVRLATMSGERGYLDEAMLIETFRLIGAVGVNTDMMGVLDVLEDQDQMVRAIELTTEQLGTPERGKVAETLDEQRADLAYTAAALATAFERPEQSASFYELSLSYDIDHPWSNNDYGYMLAENGERMDQAVEMLERAVKTLPDEASVVDSLAWVRYKLGIFDDVINDQGEVVTAGSISLLMRANDLDIERENATILLHLGDALWRGGYKERASQAWLNAEQILRGRLRLFRDNSNPNTRAIEAMSSELREIRYRIQDAESNGKPQIAPLADVIERNGFGNGSGTINQDKMNSDGADQGNTGE
jgi:tetratricopeptide (TPR) repeat protein